MLSPEDSTPARMHTKMPRSTFFPLPASCVPDAPAACDFSRLAPANPLMATPKIQTRMPANTTMSGVVRASSLPSMRVRKNGTIEPTSAIVPMVREYPIDRPSIESP